MSKLLSFNLYLFVLLFSIFSVISTLGSAQSNTWLQDFSEDNEDVDFAILHSHEKIEYRLVKGELIIQTTVETTYKALDDATFLYVEYYDENSEIEEIEIKFEDDKKFREVDYVSDEYYHSRDYFHTDVKLKFFDIKLSLKDEFTIRTKKQYNDAKYFSKADLYSHLPIVKKKLEVRIPKNVNAEFIPINFENHEVTEGDMQDDKFSGSITMYSISEVPPYSKENHTRSPKYTMPHLLVVPKSYDNEYGEEKILFDSTQDLYNWYRSLVLQMDNNSEEFRSFVQDLVEGIDNETDIVKKLYYWVQDNIRYIAFEDGIAGFKPDECQNVYSKKYGDCKGKANLLKEMLIIQGIDARLTWIGTDRIPYDYSTPCLAVDNHMICTVFMSDGQRFFLDPTESFYELGTYASRIQGQQVLIEDGDSFLLDWVPVAEVNRNKDVMSWQLKINGELLEGSGKTKYTGEYKSDILSGFHAIESGERDDAVKKLINSKDKDFLVDNLKYSDPSNRDGDFEIDYDLKLSNMIYAYGDELYVEIDKDKDFFYSEFKERESDYYFNYIYGIENSIELEVPEGYKVSYLPEGLNIDNDYFSIYTSITESDNNVIYKKSISIKDRLLPKDQFDLWNDSMKELVEFYQNQIAFKKI